MAQAPPSPPPRTSAGAAVFVYREEDLVLRGVARQAGRPHAPSRFDQVLQAGWEDRLERGLFRYRLGELHTRILPGDVGFVAQLNPQRGTERRRPQDVQSVRQRFDPQQFNFSKIRPEEVLFRLARGGAPSAGDGDGVLVVINVSPLEFGHVLLVPDPAHSLPQVLTPEALRAGLEAVLLSAHPGFRVGFNSLGAFASVNHLHLHGFYLDWELPVETAPCRPLLPEKGFHLLEAAPAPAFLFYSEGRRLAELARWVCRLTDHLLARGVAHNLFATRGAAPEGPAGCGARPGLRVLLWARRPCFGAKEASAFNVALCELAGHLPVKTAQHFEALTEEAAVRALRSHLLPQRLFSRLRHELVAQLREEPGPQQPRPPQGEARVSDEEGLERSLERS